ncbi:hypothetical protein E3Q15_02955 [Wallemia mellicola]|nr:hypothetical protein E3Q15_02955 [Wallemia mellicola]
MNNLVEYYKNDCYELPFNSLYCNDIYNNQENRISVAIELTICDIKTTKSLTIPLECIGEYDKSYCLDAISRSSQLWSSYSGYFRDSLTICQSFKPEIIQTEFLNNQLTILDYLTRLQQQLNTQIDYHEHLDKKLLIKMDYLLDNLLVIYNNSIFHLTNQMFDSHHSVVKSTDMLFNNLAKIYFDHFNLIDSNLNRTSSSISNISATLADISQYQYNTLEKSLFDYLTSFNYVTNYDYLNISIKAIFELLRAILAGFTTIFVIVAAGSLTCIKGFMRSLFRYSPKSRKLRARRLEQRSSKVKEGLRYNSAPI